MKFDFKMQKQANRNVWRFFWIIFLQKIDVKEFELLKTLLKLSLNEKEVLNIQI